MWNTKSSKTNSQVSHSTNPTKCSSWSWEEEGGYQRPRKKNSRSKCSHHLKFHLSLETFHAKSKQNVITQIMTWFINSNPFVSLLMLMIFDTGGKLCAWINIAHTETSKRRKILNHDKCDSFVIPYEEKSFRKDTSLNFTVICKFTVIFCVFSFWLKTWSHVSCY